jgi:hypothetical protein
MIRPDVLNLQSFGPRRAGQEREKLLFLIAALFSGH